MAELKMTRPQAIGTMEMLWHWTADFAPAGDIGKWDDSAIANAVEWKGESEKLVLALVESGFLDWDQNHRLVIHDWSEHAHVWLKGKMAREGLEFVMPVPLPSDSPPEEASPHLTSPAKVTSALTLDYTLVQDKWNSFAEQHGLAKLIRLSDQRKKKVAARCKDPLFKLDEVLIKVGDSPFLLGENKENWTITFDWLFENDGNWTKVIEGNYIPKDNTPDHFAGDI